MSCILCHQDEKQSKPDGSIRTFQNAKICSSCVQGLLTLNVDQIKELHKKALAKGFDEKAEILASLMEEEEHVPQTGNVRSSVARRRTVRKTRTATRKGRA
jgi:hypothetical protein